MSDQKSVLRWLDSQALAMRELTERICNINSYTDNVEGINLIRSIFREEYFKLTDRIQEIPLPSHEVVDPSGRVFHLPIASALQVQCRPDAEQKVFLCIHLDTVYHPDSPFQRCEEINPGILNGPGVIDAKGGAVVLLYALKAFEQFAQKEQLGWEVVLNTDEEIGSPSSQDFLKMRAQKSRFGLLFEPALPDGTLVDQRKGSGNFSIIVRGKSVHAGRDFENGRNAVARAAEMAAALHQLNGTSEGATINVAKIDGGGPANVVPDLAVLRLNVRVVSSEQQNWIEEQLDSLVNECDAEEGFSCELHGAFYSPPKNLDKGSAQLKACIETCAKELGLDVGWRATGGVSDGNKLAAVNVPNIDTLGVRGNHMHSSREFLVIDSLVERAKLTAMILMRFAQGEFSLS